MQLKSVNLQVFKGTVSKQAVSQDQDVSPFAYLPVILSCTNFQPNVLFELQWTEWTLCTAIKKDDFGLRKRQGECIIRPVCV